MKYEVIYDKGTRLRVRSGQYAFTKEEGYGISNLLSENDFIKEVLTSHRNGRILIYYKDIKYKEEILSILDSITEDDLFKGKPSSKEILHQLNNKFYLKLTKLIIKRYLYKIILPIPLRKTILVLQGLPYIYRALDSLTSFRFDVDLLDGTAIAASLYNHDYGPVGSMLFLLSISDLLEEYTLQKTKSTLKESLTLNIDTVWLVTTDENNKTTEISYPITKIRKGDKIKIRTGSIIPVDGVVTNGQAMVNESSMTGEPLAVPKIEGKTVHAGTTVEEGTLTIEVYSVNEETRLNKIVTLIEESENLKADIHSKAERLADSIVPYSLLTTAITYLLTGNSTKALAVLMVDFSCAIKLTTPLSIISAMREASDNRMIVKGGKFLEEYATADTIVFDKTGTLTHACPKVAKIIPLGKYTRDEVLTMSACIEEHFAHSIATAIVKQADEENLTHEEHHTEVEYIVAHGIVTQYDGQRAIIGSEHFLVDDEKVKFTKAQEKVIKEQTSKYSVIYLAIDGKLEGIICIDDPVRSEAKDVIKELKSLGITNIIILTGDSENAARTIAEELEITNYKSQVLPEDKAKIIKDLKAENKSIIMVGDGINDSPALATANVSIAMKNSSDIAREVADITLLSDNLYDLVTLRHLSTGMLNKINKNYQVIVLVNGSLIVFGLLGVITPRTSSIIHNLSTMSLGALSTRSVLDVNREKVEPRIIDC